MRRHLNSSKLPAAAITCSAALLLVCGCRNTTNAPIGTFGQTSTLAPVQGGVPLSPIQPTSGVSAFGSPTRVPPPSTGSYNVPGNYGPSTGYAPNNSTSSLPSGAAYGQAALTRGVTDLTTAGGTGNYDNSIRQTGWISDSPLPQQAPSNPAPSTTPSPDSIRAGGMQVIDLTGSPYPPGYVPPQQRPGYNYGASYPTSLPQQPPYPNVFNQHDVVTQGYSNDLSANAPLGQPTNSTFVANTNAFAGQNAMNNSAQRQASLPSTEPITDDSESNLSWRRPTPRF
ncbi:hypothetical protein [Rhodopirellula sp. MGV]|uniref:hypothetical protein n=1 Tax=Rhodopirellula sp. MGV TaxID=2023130 RepID=UPI000B973DC5|nr:hypothetical protein [Rhodopirellula sp. MGV]OYP34754.1 hypothetical protein CGZ80_14090 [Rhodopirellula sp. MGV]PNY34292.1 hypothetical protein C2E31_23965 [Rhodopirellula baltica]